MFDSEDESVLSQAKKKKEEYVEKKSVVVHTSLDYHTIKVPPMVEYKNIDSYCEKKGSVGFLTASDSPILSLKSVSSPIVFKTPQPPQPDTPLPSTDRQPYCFFSIEELSLVKSLNNWTNQKVCPVGKISFICDSSEHYLNSVGETGSWKIVVDVSNLKLKPTLDKLLQVYGMLSIPEGKPKISACFVRYLEGADLSLFVESCKLQEKYVPKSINVPKSGEVDKV